LGDPPCWKPLGGPPLGDTAWGTPLMGPPLGEIMGAPFVGPRLADPLV
jgi:hypothetical protein